MTRKYLKNFMNFTRKVLNYLIFSQAYSEAMWGNVEVVAEYLLDITEERKMFNMTLAQLSLVIVKPKSNSKSKIQINLTYRQVWGVKMG